MDDELYGYGQKSVPECPQMHTFIGLEPQKWCFYGSSFNII